MTVPLNNLTDTWNGGSTTFTALKMAVTNTASAAGSTLFDFQVGSTSAIRARALDGGLQFVLKAAAGNDHNFIKSVNDGSAQGFALGTTITAGSYEYSECFV